MEEWATPRQGTPSFSPKNAFRLMLDARCLMLDTGYWRSFSWVSCSQQSRRKAAPTVYFCSGEAGPLCELCALCEIPLSSPFDRDHDYSAFSLQPSAFSHQPLAFLL